MIQNAIPVRNNTPQLFLYTFYLPDKVTIIDLTPYVSASLELKLQGVPIVTVPATILSPPTNGQVKVASYTHTQTGVWDAQFYATDGSGNKLYGEPLQYKVVPNVDDLALTQLPQY